MRLEEIRNNPAIMMHLRFDLTKEMLARTTFNRKDAGFYFCIYVRNGWACLALMHYYPDGKATQEPLAGFPEDMILASLKEAGGSIEVNGYYPINQPIEEMLRLGLYAPGKARAGQSQPAKLNATEHRGMQIDEIKDTELRKLFLELKQASSTIENDGHDALNESKNDEELIDNWQSKLNSLYEEVSHFWGTLEELKSGKAANIHTGGINCIRNPRIKCIQKAITAPPEYAEHPACMLGLKCDVRGL